MKVLEPSSPFNSNKSTTTVVVPCTSYSENLEFTATYGTSSSKPSTNPPLVYTTTFTTTTLPFYTTVFTIVYKEVN